MAEVNISMNGRVYEISCDDGQEGRVLELAAYIDQRLQKIARSGAAYNDAHLMVLTTLVLADELFDMRDDMADKPVAKQGKASEAAKTAETAPANAEDEKMLLNMLDKLTKRIDGIAARVQAA
jgi:cell division protein ZapA